jgi:predicted RecA/RadA family phage recombinase
MRDKVIRGLGTRGLIVIALCIFAGLLCVASKSPLAATMGSLPLVFGMATAAGADSIQNLRTLKYTHDAALEAGDVIVVNGSMVIAVNKRDANVANSFIYMGKVTVPKTAALAISALDKVYWDDAAGECNKTDTNTACGFCVDAAAAADSTVTIMLLPSIM